MHAVGHKPFSHLPACHSCAVNQIVVIPQGIAKIHISHFLPIEIIAREGNKSGK
nr:MAG TPA: deoxynucleoside triphosphate triphosphohydrolase [Caudoviricetes sp.]